MLARKSNPRHNICRLRRNTITLQNRMFCPFRRDRRITGYVQCLFSTQKVRFFEYLANRLVGRLFNDVQFDALVAQQTQCPTVPTFRRGRAGQRDQACFSPTVENRRFRRRCTLFPFECAFKTFFDKTFTNIRHRIRMAMKTLADLLIAQRFILRLVDRNQNLFQIIKIFVNLR